MYPLPHLTNYLYMSQTAQPGFTRLNPIKPDENTDVDSRPYAPAPLITEAEDVSLGAIPRGRCPNRCKLDNRLIDGCDRGYCEIGYLISRANEIWKGANWGR